MLPCTLTGSSCGVQSNRNPPCGLDQSSCALCPQSNGQSAHDDWSKPQGGFRLDWTPQDDPVSVQGNIFTLGNEPSGTVSGQDLVANWQHKFSDGSSLQLLTYYDDAKRYS